jgi:hypothetical protein
MLFRHETRQEDPDRPSEFRVPVEERTQIEAGPVEYATSPDQVEGEGYYAEHGEPEIDEKPVAVYMVEPPPHAPNWTDWTAATVGLSNQPTQFGDASRIRMRFLVRNLDAVNPIYCARLRTDGIMAAYTLPAGQNVEFFHNGPICLWADNAGTQATFFAEYDVDDPD